MAIIIPKKNTKIEVFCTIFVRQILTTKRCSEASPKSKMCGACRKIKVNTK